MFGENRPTEFKKLPMTHARCISKPVTIKGGGEEGDAPVK